ILLDKFNISYDEKDKPYSILSPGERTRINLVKLALEKINVLILDEVTNHLDKEALDLIYELVEGYEGTIISISHNRRYNEYLDADIEVDITNGNIKHKSLIRHR
ncbi:MAG: ABC transporter ATP-binding protein, partial [bacterium]|nr:ABC transporter ATP-binding protein [bacterium]